MLSKRDKLFIGRQTNNGDDIDENQIHRFIDMLFYLRNDEAIIGRKINDKEPADRTRSRYKILTKEEPG